MVEIISFKLMVRHPIICMIRRVSAMPILSGIKFNSDRYRYKFAIFLSFSHCNVKEMSLSLLFSMNLIKLLYFDHNTHSRCQVQLKYLYYCQKLESRYFVSHYKHS